jgi:hypothetical protein
MTASRTRPFVAALAIGVLSLLALAGPSHAAAAFTDTFSFQAPLLAPVDFTDTCLGPGATGTITGTTTGSGRFVVNDRFAFMRHGTVTTDFRVDFVDGRFAIGALLQHTSDTAINFSHTTDTEVTQGSATLYDPAGQPLGPVTIHAVSHVTWTDRNHNGQPDPDEFTGFVDQFRLTCG